MTTGLLDFGFAGDEAASLYCFGAMNCITFNMLIIEQDKIFLLLKTVLVLVA